MHQSEVLIARQPIYTTDRNVAAYELLYRSSEINVFDPTVDGNFATRTVITEALLNFGTELLPGGTQGFVNFTEDLIREKLPLLLEPEIFAIEVLENVALTAPVLECLSEFREKGFTIALDDYSGEPLTEEQLACFDIIKLDFMSLDPLKRSAVIEPLRKAGKILLAEKVESEEEFEDAKRLGCTLFQGFYFARPKLLRRQRHAIATGSAVRLTGLLSNNDYEIDRLADVVRNDANLTYKLLKKMNTLEYYRGHQVKSVEQALVRMGERGILRWAALVLMETYMDHSEDELLKIGLIRGRFCERLAERNDEHAASSDAFLVGLFSILDVSGTGDVSPLDELNLPTQVMEGLRDEYCPLNGYLRTAERYEHGIWPKSDDSSSGYLVQIYLDAVGYAEKALSIAEDAC